MKYVLLKPIKMIYVLSCFILIGQGCVPGASIGINQPPTEVPTSSSEEVEQFNSQLKSSAFQDVSMVPVKSFDLVDCFDNLKYRSYGYHEQTFQRDDGKTRPLYHVSSDYYPGLIRWQTMGYLGTHALIEFLDMGNGLTEVKIYSRWKTPKKGIVGSLKRKSHLPEPDSNSGELDVASLKADIEYCGKN